MTIKSTNTELGQTIKSLKKKANETGAAIWDDVANYLNRSKHSRISVNVSKINNYTKSKDKIIVPGKILAGGVLDHPVQIAAFKISKNARDKILKAKGTCYTINEFIEKFPKGTGIKLIG